jgi:hypothetical protein
MPQARIKRPPVRMPADWQRRRSGRVIHVPADDAVYGFIGSEKSIYSFHLSEAPVDVRILDEVDFTPSDLLTCPDGSVMKIKPQMFHDFATAGWLPVVDIQRTTEVSSG